MVMTDLLLFRDVLSFVRNYIFYQVSCKKCYCYNKKFVGGTFMYALSRTSKYPRRYSRNQKCTWFGLFQSRRKSP